MENLEKYKLNRNILCIDLKSFYASVECILRGLDPFTTPLVVADKSRGSGSIVLAVSPYLKSQGIPSRCRIFDLPENSNIIFARPQMALYLDYSAKVIDIYLDYVSRDDVYIYSIDESFLDVTNYLNYYEKTDIELASEILKKIKDKLGLSAACGVGSNMLLSKLSLDLEAKNNKDFIAKWNYDDVKEKLWPITPISKMWGIGSRMEKRLNVLGLQSIGDIANYDVKKLKKRFGILGEELYYHTHGIDMSMVRDQGILRKKAKSFGISQVLFRDYNADEILTIITEMIDDVARRLRLARRKAKTIALTIGYSKDYSSGFNRQVTIDVPTNSEKVIYEKCILLFDQYYEGYPIRTVGISLSKLSDHSVTQLSLFEDIDELDREYKLQTSIDKIKAKHGKNSVTRATAELEHSTAKARNKQIGGHHV